MEIIIGMIKIMTLNNANTCTLCEYRIILNVLIVCLFLKEITFPKKLSSGMRSEHQTVLILIRALILVGLIWVQNVCKAEDIMYRAKYYNFN